MKTFIQNSILFSLFLLISITSIAQQVSELDPKFVKIPRYADLTAITAAITSPTQGMIVHNNATSSNWYYNGFAWVNMAILSLPYSQTQTLHSGDLFSITNNFASTNNMVSSIRGEFNGAVTSLLGKGIGVYGRGIRTSGTGVAYGVYGETVSDIAVAGVTNTIFATGTGVLGYSDAGYGVNGNANSGIGGYFSSTSGYALITANGNVGIGTNTPTAKLHVNGYTKLGSNAPAIRTVELTETTSPSNSGYSAGVAHNLDASKIISVSVIVFTDGLYIPPAYDDNLQLKYNYYFNSTAITIKNQASSCVSGTHICNKTAKILVTYKE